MELIDELEVFTMTDQPTTCGRCGCRTDFTEKYGIQLHQCLNEKCGYKFIVEDSDNE